jgi:CRISPR-associated protein Cas2
MHYVAAYDIEQDRRRTRVMNALKDFGLRVQYSVFECELTADRLNQLRSRLAAVIDKRHDRVHIYALCDNCYFRSEGLGQEDP